MNMQLAIQGGGAKIVTLLGAASAIQELRHSPVHAKRLVLKRVMGTSAGAIVGAMLAADVDLVRLRERILNHWRGRLLADLSHWPVSYVKVPWGTPLWRSESLREMLTEVLAEQNVRYIGDVLAHGVDLRVVATDLATQKPVIYSSSDPAQARTVLLVDALMDSCAIPYFLRTWQHGFGKTSVSGTVVDGGIVQNFPCKDLLDLASMDGEVFGLSFVPDKPGPIRGFRKFGKALLDAAMENAASEARAKLGDRVHRLSNRYDTFDFKGAFSDEGLGDHYDLSRSDTLRWFTERIEFPHTFLSEDLWSRQSRASMTSLARMYEVQDKDCHFTFESVMVQVTAHGLLDDRSADETLAAFTFRTTSKTAYCHRVSISDTTTLSDLQSSKIKMWCGNLEMKIEILPMIDLKDETRKDVLIIFMSPLPPNSGPYTIQVRDSVRGLTRDLLQKREDTLVSSVERTVTPLQNGLLIVHLPHFLHGGARATVLKTLTPGGVAGSEILADHRRYPPPAGFESIWWEASMVPAGQNFGFDLQLPPAL